MIVRGRATSFELPLTTTFLRYSVAANGQKFLFNTANQMTDRSTSGRSGPQGEQPDLPKFGAATRKLLRVRRFRAYALLFRPRRVVV